MAEGEIEVEMVKLSLFRSDGLSNDNPGAALATNKVGRKYRMSRILVSLWS